MILLMTLPPTKELRPQSKYSRDLGRHCSLAGLFSNGHLVYFLYCPGAYAQEIVPPIVTLALLHQLMIKIISYTYTHRSICST